MAKQSTSMARNYSISHLGGRSGSVGPKSLNISNRKNENLRIERDNQRFAKKLFENKGDINKRKHDREFYNATQYRNQISKVNKANRVGLGLPPTFDTTMLNKTNRLPPLAHNMRRNKPQSVSYRS